MRATATVPILMYHSISSSTNPLFSDWAVPPAMFAEHVAYLAQGGYTPLTVTDLINARRTGAALPARPIALTFDDAYEDFYTDALPTLARHHFPATLYVPTAFVGGACGWLREDGEGSRRMASWAQLAEIAAAGIECGGHSHNHLQMDTLPAVTVNQEVRRCKRLLEEHLGHEVTSFAYPHGWSSAEVRRITQAAGYTSACAVKNMRSAANDDPFALARLRVWGDMDVAALAALLAREMTPVEVALRNVARMAIRLAPRGRAALSHAAAHRQALFFAGALPAAVVETPPASPPSPPSSPSGFTPVAMVEIELGEPLRALGDLTRADGMHYQRALALVRLHTQPLGLVELNLGHAGLNAETLAARVWAELESRINTHLVADGLPVATSLDADGLVSGPNEPACLARRRAFLASAPFVSVVIPTHNRPTHVAELVRSVLASDYPAERFEVVVVDNAPSANDTALYFNETYADSTQVRYVREDRAGSSNARNCGLEQARGEIVVFADDDELVDRHWLAEMVRGFGARRDVQCVTGLVAPMEIETQAQGWFEQFGGYCKAGFTSRLFNLTDHRAESPLYPYNVGVYGSGGSMAFRRATLLNMQAFDPALGPATPTLGGEDVDAMLRVVLAGHTLAYMPTAIVRHPSHREYAQLRKQMLGYGSGLSAVLFKTLVTQPRRAPDFLSKLPRGLRFAFGAGSAHHAGKQADYPRELTRIEMRGLLAGPFAYLRSRRRLAMATSRTRTLDYLREQTPRLQHAR